MKRAFLTLAIALITTGTLFSQERTVQDTDTYVTDSLELYKQRKNILKLSLTSLAFRNFQFSYERVLNKTFSASISYSFIPEGNVPFEGLISNLADDEDFDDILDSSSFSYNSFTLELRIYTKGHGRGLYFAPFYRNANYDIKDVPYDFTSDEGTSEEIDASGEIKTNTFGLLIGTQFKLGNRMVLDWWILGPHIGTSSGNVLATSNESLSINEQNSLRNELEDIFLDIDLIDTEVEVDANSANVIVDGPWAGLRAGFSLGYRF